MTRSEFHGKRGANAGDDFHELWALRRALETISPASSVQKVTVEGVAAEDELGSDGPEWDGVDCAIYHGQSVDSVQRIEIAQLKYSAATPSASWTVARITYSEKKKRKNSVIARLAEAYVAIAKRYPLLAIDGKIAVKLVSNQPACDELLELGSDSSVVNAIKVAASLDDDQANLFVEALDFSECGSIGREGLEERFVLDIAAWGESNALQNYSKFREFVRRRMRPEGRGSDITSESVLSIFGSADPRSIFPCPSNIEKVGTLISRAASDHVLSYWRSSKKRVCLHGQGGEGKTTVLQDIAAKLPMNSVVVAFDCYGGGSYLNSDAYRHRQLDAFLQLTNEAASSLLLPLFLAKNRDADHPQLFMRKLEQAARSLAEVDRNALLIIAVDAMDNAVAAARDATDQSVSFVPAFLKLSEPPENVRFLVSARTGRLHELSLPDSFEKVSLGPFSELETKTLLEQHVAPQSDEWLDQVHILSGGNPRVLTYAIEAADNRPSQILAYLSPHGKNLDGIFAEILSTAFKKVGSQADVKRLCATLSLLPRPAPISTVAAVSGLTEAHVLDILSDLRPGIILEGNKVSFRDEDFEAFVRTRAANLIEDVLQAAADLFAKNSLNSSYEAEHAANILLRAGRFSDILALAKQDISAYPIDDPAVRTVVHEARMRAAISICRKTGNTSEAMKLLLAGADAFRKDAAIRELLFENLDLAANFSRDQMRQLFLSDPDKRPYHGSFLMHAIAAAAGDGDNASAASQRRLLGAWFDSRNDRVHAEHDEHDRDDWKLDSFDLAAYAAGIAESAGIDEAIRFIQDARPSDFRCRISNQLIERLARSSKFDALSDYLVRLPKRYPGKGLAQAFLALAGHPFDIELLLSEIEACLPSLTSMFEATRSSYEEPGFANDRLELLITAVEIAAIHKAPKRRLVPLLTAMSSSAFRSAQELTRFAHFSSNVALRALALLSALKNQDLTASACVPKQVIKGRSKASKAKRRERDEQIQKAAKEVGRVLPALKVRARAIVGTSERTETIRDLAAATQSLSDFYFHDRDRFDARPRDLYLARSFVVLAALPDVEANAIFELAVGLFKEYEFPARSGASELLRYAHFIPAFSKIVPEKVRAICADWRHIKEPGREKIELISRYARIALFQDQKVAGEAFLHAVEIATEIDAESTQALNVCDQISERAHRAMNAQQKRQLAKMLSAITKDVAERVGSEDGFPWEEIASCLARIDLSQALATCARFSEIGLVDADTFLDPIVSSGLQINSMSLGCAVALSAVLESPSSKLIDLMISRDALSDPEMLEYLAWEVMCRKTNKITDMTNRLEAAGAKPSGTWGKMLSPTAHFLAGLHSDRDQTNTYGQLLRSDRLAAFDWSKIGSAEQLIKEIAKIKDAARRDAYVTFEEVLSNALKSIPEHRKVELLGFVTSRPEEFHLTYQLGPFLKNWLSQWSGNVAVDRWCQNNLLRVIRENLPEIARNIEMRQSQLPDLVAMTGADEVTIIDALLEGIEANIDGLHSAQVYHLAAEISRYAEPEACAAALEDHLARRLKRLPLSERELASMTDVPYEPDEAIGRFLFACLGSPIAPLRWRAAHSVRRLATLDQTKMLEHVVDCFSRFEESSFGHPEAPFYQLNAKLWLLIAIARVAWEKPSKIESFKSCLLEVGESEELPHVLLRSFAQLALNGLSNSGAVISVDEQRRITAINEPSKPPRKRPKGARYSIFEKYGFDHTKGRSFDFDTMDTLPHLYDRAIRSFANPSGSAFLDRAEYWIVEKWGARQRAYEIDALRKSSGLWQRRDLSSSRSHGSRPSLESYSAYLEFHAMHCAVGDFLKTESLAKDSDQWENFEGWLSRQSLTSGPIWLSDFRNPKPLEAQFWARPTGDKAWLRKREAQDIRTELLLYDPEWLVLASDHWGSDNEVRSTVRIESCLVSPESATSLRRALESSQSSYEYRLAIGEDNEIDEGEFQQRSILSDKNTELGLDEHDRFRGELGPISIRPRKWIIDLLGISPCTSGFPIWTDGLGKSIIAWKSWSDEGSHDGEQSSYYYRVHGSRLVIRRCALETIMDSTGMDLAVELTMKREMGDRYGRRASSREEDEFDRIILFRKEGQIEATGQRLGNWRPHRARTRTRR